jgi:serine/threonine protein kinase
VLGKGSFGEVFLVKKKGEEQLYAMKTLLKSKVKAQNLTKYVMTERVVLTLMNNPFIVQIHGAFQTKDKLYLVLEYCPGGDLEKKIIKEKKIPEDIVKMYAAEITLAIESLHKREIIFRDLKPANVVLDS